MSTLMLIKYPVSYPPTRNQIESLPDDIFEAWLNSCRQAGFPLASPFNTKQFMHKLITEFERQSEGSSKSLVDALIRIIYMLDEYE